jgi:signal transduction histidine kinase
VTPLVHDYDWLPDGVLVADYSGRVVHLNRAGARILRLTPEQVCGRDYSEVLPLSDPTGRQWWACTRPYDGLATRTGQPERYLLLPDGRELLVTARYVRPEPGAPLSALLVCFRDAAARERGQRDQADLVTTVAHELRSPLTSVKGFTATLLNRWDRFTESQKLLMLETVNADADRVTRLISELLDVSRIHAGRLEIGRQVVDVPAAVQRAIRGRVAAGIACDRFELHVRGELPEMWLDADKVDQIISNLLDNAVRHGAGLVTVTVEPRVDTREPGVVLTVTDEGEGIPLDRQSQVFRKFWRGNRRGGTGLGLYIVKGLVDAHGGTITVGRASSGGAELRVELPVGTPDFAIP